MPSRRVWKLLSIRLMVASSNRSALYASPPFKPCACSNIKRLRSNFTFPLPTNCRSRLRLGSSSVSRGMFCSANITGEKGTRLRSRSGLSSSTSFSNGISWWS
jgi:hypothetical protein